jgi:hypothetical protein
MRILSRLVLLISLGASVLVQFYDVVSPAFVFDV